MLTFLTRIPMPIQFDVEYEDYVSAVFWTPIIALIIGAPLYFLQKLSLYIDPYILSVCILALYLFISGGLHLDGLADTMDAFGSNRSRQRKLEILSDSHIGTFGVLSIAIYCLSMFVLITKVPPFSLLLFPLVGRTAALVCAKTHTYARETGLGKSFVEGTKLWYIGFSIVLYAGFAYLVLGRIDAVNILIALIPFVLSVVIIWAIVHGMCKKIGGITGDLIGFSIESTTVLFLLFTYITNLIAAQVIKV